MILSSIEFCWFTIAHYFHYGYNRNAKFRPYVFQIAKSKLNSISPCPVAVRIISNYTKMGWNIYFIDGQITIIIEEVFGVCVCVLFFNAFSHFIFDFVVVGRFFRVKFTVL